MDVVLVGLPGSGKSVVGKRLAAPPRRVVHRPRRADRARRRPADPEIFAERRRGRLPGARARGRRRPRAGRPRPERAARDRDGRRRGRRPAQPLGPLPRPGRVWLDGRPEVLAQRLRRSPHVRPLITGRDPIGAVRDLAARRERFYAAAAIHVDRRRRGRAAWSTRSRPARSRPTGAARGTTLLRASTPIGRIVLGDGIAADGARRARCGGSRPGARSSSPSPARGRPSASGWRADLAPAGSAGRARSMLPEGEAAKRLAVDRDAAASELARLRVERARADRRDRRRRARRRGRLPGRDLPARRPVHPGADDARRPDRFVDRRQDRRRPARGQEPRRRVPPAGRDRHRRRAPARPSPSASCGPRSARRSRWRPSATSGCSSCSSRRGEAIARGRRVVGLAPASWPSSSSGARGPRSRSSWPTSASAGPAAAGSRSTSATRWATRFEAAAGYAELLHGEAVAYGLRAAARIGAIVGVTPPERAARIGRLLDRLGLAREPLPYALDAVLAPPRDRQEARRRPAALGAPDRGRRRGPRRRPDAVVVDAAGSLLAAGGPPDDARPRPPGPEPQPGRHARARDLRVRDARRDPRRDRRRGPSSSGSRSTSSSRTTRARSSTGCTSATSTSRSSTPAA